MKFIAEDNSLVVKFEGLEVLWGLKRKLVLPRDKIVDLVWAPEFDTADLMVRIGGSNVPRLILAGHFRDMDAKETLYIYLRRPKGFTLSRNIHDTNVLTVTMRDYTYAKVIVNCDPDIGASLMNWFGINRLY
jgi:hypothetical protein